MPVPVKPTDEPRHLVADSKGLKLYGESEWQVMQQGLISPSPGRRRLKWVIPPQRNAIQRIAKRRYRQIEARNERVQSILHMGRKR